MYLWFKNSLTCFFCDWFVSEILANTKIIQYLIRKQYNRLSLVFTITPSKIHHSNLPVQSHEQYFVKTAAVAVALPCVSFSSTGSTIQRSPRRSLLLKKIMLAVSTFEPAEWRIFSRPAGPGSITPAPFVVAWLVAQQHCHLWPLSSLPSPPRHRRRPGRRKCW